MTRSTGMYICLEGVDGSGKTTLARHLAGQISATGKPAQYENFPSAGPIGSLIRQGLSGDRRLARSAYLYLFAADAIDRNGELEKLVYSGVDVICDRHPTLSGVVFQVDEHPEDVVRMVYREVVDCDLLMPDYLFVLDVAPEVSLERMRGREKYKDVVYESEDIARIETIRRRYLEVARQNDGYILDGTRSTEDLARDVLSIIGLNGEGKQ